MLRVLQRYQYVLAPAAALVSLGTLSASPVTSLITLGSLGSLAMFSHESATAVSCAPPAATDDPWDAHDEQEWTYAQRLLYCKNKDAGGRFLHEVLDRISRGQSVGFPAAKVKEVEVFIDRWGFVDDVRHELTRTQTLYMKRALLGLLQEPKSRLMQVTYAAATGCAVTVECLVDKYHAPVNGPGCFDDPVLYYAIVMGNVDAVKFLVAQPGTDVNYYHEQGGLSCLDMLMEVLVEKQRRAQMGQVDALWTVWQLLMDAGKGNFLGTHDRANCEALKFLVRWGPLALLRSAAAMEPTNFALGAPSMLAVLIEHTKAFTPSEWQQRFDLVMAHVPTTHPLCQDATPGSAARGFECTNRRDFFFEKWCS
jgi:hypothetical protein